MRGDRLGVLGAQALREVAGQVLGEGRVVGQRTGQQIGPQGELDVREQRGQLR
ncbi:Uncharacterised protein [Mycobacteroides abscessus subsp. abscessus]|nr:Uncharacterised protein [Mycobacteroides abscessus subsp. abscessus]